MTTFNQDAPELDTPTGVPVVTGTAIRHPSHSTGLPWNFRRLRNERHRFRGLGRLGPVHRSSVSNLYAFGAPQSLVSELTGKNSLRMSKSTGFFLSLEVNTFWKRSLLEVDRSQQ